MIPFLRKLAWWSRSRKEQELRDELQFHLEEETRERLDDGLAAEDAARAARRDLGNPALVREDTRAVWSWVLAEQLSAWNCACVQSGVASGLPISPGGKCSVVVFALSEPSE